MLRPRYRPGWIPSWTGTKKNPVFCEDAKTLPARPHLIDATRLSDGKLVYIKRVQTGDNESQLATMLSSETLRKDPRNNCVPVIDLFQDSDDPTISYMVMPFLRLVNDPPFTIIEDLVDFIEQMLQGLVFLHENGVAHRDCSYKNVMMDASAMYPHGFHPVKEDYLPDGETGVEPLPRSTVSIRYYYVDFGISVLIPPDVHPKLTVGELGRDREPPELSPDVPYDPFKLDVFLIGNLFRRLLYDEYSNVEFLSSLFGPMIRDDPASRPDAQDALQQWHTIRKGLSFFNRRWELRSREETRSTFVLDAMCFVKVAMYAVRQLFGWAVDVQG
ncbi:predicted protein [Sparassis crispa]|uniref:Protein kinase domain-containing protein n=2 Tax=Sparassis TaxID=40466 RepID=A0A401GAM5_9APHY|nr:predicted protein [Sparassis crispa]GBE79224.1 predicted protein [Sparassis crispa]